jgi:anti-sigma factor (TIGR02949 family)
LLSCRDVVAQLSEYLDGELSASERQLLDYHLAHCEHCTALYDSTRKTIRLVTESATWDLPVAIVDRVAENVLTELGRRLPPPTSEPKN